MDDKCDIKVLCKDFYQHKSCMNVECFYALTKIQWGIERKHRAATKIQSYFRGWLTRKNLQLLTKAAIKIQSWIRGFLARTRVDLMKELIEEQREKDRQEAAAIRIQSAWRGYYSRTFYYDYRRYKSIQAKNARLVSSVESLNQLEIAAMKPSSTGSHLQTENIVDKFLRSGGATLEDVLRLSPSRISAVLAKVESLNEECSRKGFRPRRCSLELVEKLKAIQGSRAKRENLEQLFPHVPSHAEVIRPKPYRLEQLKEAIGKFRCTMEVAKEEELARKHHLLRTYHRPGVLSDITTHRLTPQEQKLKNLRFWQHRHHI